MRKIRNALAFFIVFAGAALLVAAQQEPQPSNQPQVKVNMLNVCTPSAEEQKEIASALARIPKQTKFGSDFEISRGRSTLTDMPSFLQAASSAQVSDKPSIASYVRIRREFPDQSPFSNVQYSFSNDGQNMVETLVLHIRDPKDVIQISLEDSASSVTSPSTMLTADTPVSRIRLERFGKSSVALARCSGADGGAAVNQSAYEPLFRSASELLDSYRNLLAVKKTVPQELAKIAAAKAASSVDSNLRHPVQPQR